MAPDEPGGWPDNALDAIALVEAIRGGDAEGQRVIVISADWHATMLVLARLLAVAADESDAPDDHLRIWALSKLHQGPPEP